MLVVRALNVLELRRRIKNPRGGERAQSKLHHKEFRESSCRLHMTHGTSWASRCPAPDGANWSWHKQDSSVAIGKNKTFTSFLTAGGKCLWCETDSHESIE